MKQYLYPELSDRELLERILLNTELIRQATGCDDGSLNRLIADFQQNINKAQKEIA